MLRIRKETMDVLIRNQEEIFYKKVAESLRKDFSSLVRNTSDALLRDHIFSLHQKAKKYGIKTERDVFKFVCLGTIAGIDFDEQSPIHTILTDEYFSPREKLDILLYALEQKEKSLRET